MRLLSRSFLLGVGLLVLHLTASATLCWSQNNDSNSNDNQPTLLSWNDLYSEGWKIYEQQENTLIALNLRISSLERGSSEWMSLSERLSVSNQNLKEFNAQIAERMQERDEDLYWAYQDIEKLEKKNLTKLIWIIGLASLVVILVLLIVLILKFKSIKLLR